jgi:hypothetical protein
MGVRQGKQAGLIVVGNGSGGRGYLQSYRLLQSEALGGKDFDLGPGSLHIIDQVDLLRKQAVCQEIQIPLFVWQLL